MVAGVDRDWGAKMGALALLFVFAFVSVVYAVNLLSARVANPMDRFMVAVAGLMALAMLTALMFMVSLRMARAP